jgi:enamine deaminase RidA (YjgF/YER057c/UK114 family)
VRADDLLLCSGMMAVDGAGPVSSVQGTRDLRYLGIPARAQMQHIVESLRSVCAAGGTTIENVVRIHQFHTDLAEFYPMHRAWQEALAGGPVPFTALRVPGPLPVPACSVIVDPWFFAP